MVYDAIVNQYDVIAEFTRAVAARSKRTPGTEKKALYRFINKGDAALWRLRIYADLLHLDPKIAAAAPAQTETAEVLDRLDEIRDLVLTLHPADAPPTSTVMNQVEDVSKRLHAAAESAPLEELAELEKGLRLLAAANTRVADAAAVRRRRLGEQR